MPRAPLLPLIALAGTLAAAERPNVVVILADDLGYADCGLTGLRDVPTPNIDAIAAQGVRFTNSYVSAAISSPSRAGLLTGRYQERWGHDGNEDDELPLGERTLADRLRELGYVTGMVGKWHLGGKPELLPPQRGFDEVFHPDGNARYFGASVLDTRTGPGFRPAKDRSAYTTELVSARAAEFIAHNRQKPFFLYVAFNNVHAPYQVPATYTDRVTVDTPNADRRTMLGMILALDDAVGTVTGALRTQGVLDHTLVVFLNDNGSYEKAVKERICSNAPFRGGKSTVREGGIRVPCAMQWTGRIKPGTVYERPVISLDIMPTAIAAAGGTVRPEWKLDGVDLMPHLTGATASDPHDLLFWRLGMGKQAVRKGDWKLVSDGRTDALYDVAADPAEGHNLAAANPALVAEMRKAWNAWNAELPAPRVQQPRASREP